MKSTKAEQIKNHLHTAWLGQNLIYYEETDSTNVQVSKAAYEGATNGTVIIADKQTAGRGRRGRSWESPAGKNLYFSLLLKPDLPVEKTSMLTLVMAHAVLVGIRKDMLRKPGMQNRPGMQNKPGMQELAGGQTQAGILEVDSLTLGIKWPNDIVINGKKVCGILTELRMEKDQIHHVVIGVGINVEKQIFPEELVDKATDLESECGYPIAKESLLGSILEAFEQDYEQFLKEGSFACLREEYEALLVNKDREVCVLEPKGEWNGIAKGITDTGELIVELPDGTMQKVYAGEVSVRGVYGYV